MEFLGKIDSIIFSNRQTGFHVFRARIDKDSTPTSVSGTFPGVALSSGLKIKINGDWSDHPKYGRQISATSCEVIPEAGRNGIISFLQLNVPSIGPMTASRLYEALGDGLIEAMEKDHDKIVSLPFLTKIQASEIIKEWSTSSDNRTASIFLSDLGLNQSQIKSVYSKFGTNTKDRVRQNPYCMCECSGVGFQTADNAALKLGMGTDDIRRVKAFVLHSIYDLCNSEGHMYCTSSQIRDHSSKLLRKSGMERFSHGDCFNDSSFFEALFQMKNEGSIESVDGKIYPSSYWAQESYSAVCVSEMIKSAPKKLGDIDSILNDFEKNSGTTLSPEQREAFCMLKRTNICAISGFPGTGKTLLISAFVHLFEVNKLHYVLLSPTGIAAKRLSQVTGKQASTIHRSLGLKGDGTWEFDKVNKFMVDAVIVDEMSMVDGSTFFHLISSLPSSTILIMVGDTAQLPSVGPGYVLNNITNNSGVPHVALTKIFRQEYRSDIIKVAHQILTNQKVDVSFNSKSEFVFLPFPREQVLEEICKFSSALKNKLESDPSTFQIIAPMYNGDLGVNNLNTSLREVLNPDYKSGKSNSLGKSNQRIGKNNNTDFFEGDRVMIVKNDYTRMVFNGDVGKILRISQKNDEVDVKIFDWFDNDSVIPSYSDKVFTYKIREARDALRVAYACTTHKVQGQEFDYVIMPMTMQYGIMLYRNLVYTAITRAKRKVFIFGDPNAFTYAISNNREVIRNSSLSDLIRSQN